MPVIVRLLFIFICSVLPAMSATPSMASDRVDAGSAIEPAVASCMNDPQCNATVRKRETSAAEKRRQREAEDSALRESDPRGYYLTLLARFAKALAFIAGSAGIYVLIMHLLFGKRKRGPKR